MMRARSLLLVTLLASSLVACSLPAVTHDKKGAAFDPPVSKSGEVLWHFGNQEEVDKICKGLPVFTSLSSETQARLTVIHACMYWKRTQCVIVTLPPNTGNSRLMLDIQHEVAHCQGWMHPSYEGM